MRKLFKFAKEIKYEISVFLLFVVSRLPKLGYDVFNTDVWKWKARIYDFGSGVFYLDFIKTVQKYHPGVTLMWIGTFAVKFYNLYYNLVYGTAPPDNNISTVFGLHFFQKLFVVFVIAFVIAMAFYALRKVFGVRYAVIAVFLISLEPFYIALTRVVHLEGLLSTFMVGSFAWLYFYLKDTKKLVRLIVSGIFGGLSILTKTSAVFIIPFSGLMLFLDFLVEDRNFAAAVRKSLSVFIRWIFVVLACFIILWPAMWSYPQVAVEALYRGIFTIGVERGHEQLYIYRWVLDPGLWFYAVVVVLRSSLYLILGLIGLVPFLIYNKAKKSPDKYKFIFYALLFSVFYAVELTIPSKKLDRYILPSILGLLLAVSFFYEWLLGLIKDKIAPKAGFYILFILLAAPSIYLAQSLHPDYFSYYSPLGGGLKKGMFLIEPKWAFGQDALKAKLLELKEERDFGSFEEGESLDNSPSLEDRLVVAFPEKYYTQLWPFVREIGGWAVIQDLSPDAKLSGYFVYPVWDDKSSLESRYMLEYKDSVYLRGTEIYRIFSRKDLLR